MKFTPHTLLFKVAIILVFAAVSQSVFAQTAPIEPEIIQGDANACELNSSMFNVLSHELRDNNDERLFVIARLGKGDVSRDLNRRRLHNVRTAFRQGWVTD